MSTTQEGTSTGSHDNDRERHFPLRYTVGSVAAAALVAGGLGYVKAHYPFHGQGCYQKFSLGAENVTDDRKITLPDGSHDVLLVFVGADGQGIDVKAQGAGSEVQAAHLDASPQAAASTAFNIGKYAISFKIEGDNVVTDCQPVPLSVTTHP